MMNRTTAIFGGSVTFVASVFAGNLAFRKEAPKGEGPFPTAVERVKTYDGIASTYDSQIGWDETVMGVWLLRRWLTGRAKGDVLEVATGTGRNHEYYDKVTLGPSFYSPVAPVSPTT